MAPTAPSSTKRKTLRLKAAERLANPLAPRKVHRPDSVVSDTFLETKRDKKLIKHSAFVSKITTSTSTSSSSSSNRISKAARKNAKRHAAAARNTHLQTNLESLADALPELTTDEVLQGRAERDGRVRHKSLKSRPGALRKKERVVRGEMERFGMSLAQLSAVTESSTAKAVPAATTTTTTETETTMEVVVGAAAPQQAPSAAANRFAALRGFISATMEQNPAFAASTSTSKGS